jgi:capsular exopolysaccharide synthesis family protein
MTKNSLDNRDDEFRLEKYWEIVRNRIPVLALFVLLALALGALKIFTSSPVYKATGVLMVKPENDNVVIFGDRLALGRTNEYFNTQVRILRSRSLARTVLEEFNPTPYKGIVKNTGAGSNTLNPMDIVRIQQFLRGLEVTPLTETRLVEVSFLAQNPKRAAEVVNILFKKFIEFNNELRTESTRQASEFITRQIRDLQQELARKELELQKYGKSKDLFYLTNEESTEVGKFSELNQALTQAQIERINRESIFRDLQNKDMNDFPQVRGNTLISGLKSTYSGLEADYNRKLQVFKPSYPEMLELRSQMSALQQRIGKEIKDIADRVLNESKNDYEAALKRETSLTNLLDSQKSEMIKSNSDAIYYKSLSIEVANMRELQNYLDRKHKESLITSRLQGVQTSNIKVIDPADTPLRPIAPKKKIIMLMALFLGISGGLAFVLLLNVLDQTVKEPDGIKNLMNSPILGIIPSSRSRGNISKYLGYSYYRKNRKVDLNTDIEMINLRIPESAIADAYRNIRTSILLTSNNRPSRVISISSARPSEGKTSTAVNLAVAFAQLGKKVLLIDGDMRNPRLHKIFKIKNTTGLSSYLVGKVSLQETIINAPVANMYIIPSGPIPPNPVELLDSEPMSALFKAPLLMECDYIFIDTPPFIEIVDPILLAKHSDGMVLVTWVGKTKRNAIEKLKEQVDQFKIPLFGIVLNMVDLKKSWYDYNYTYQYNYSNLRRMDGEVKSSLKTS